VDAISKCRFNYAPWFVIPANRKWFRNLAISQIQVETMEDWKMKYPEPTVDLNLIKQKYHAEVAEAMGIPADGSMVEEEEPKEEGEEEKEKEIS
jgi:hypothetical protein